MRGRYDLFQLSSQSLGFATHLGGDISLLCDEAVVDRGLVKHGQYLLSGGGDGAFLVTVCGTGTPRRRWNGQSCGSRPNCFVRSAAARRTMSESGGPGAAPRCSCSRVQERAMPRSLEAGSDITGPAEPCPRHVCRLPADGHGEAAGHTPRCAAAGRAEGAVPEGAALSVSSAGADGAVRGRRGRHEAAPGARRAPEGVVCRAARAGWGRPDRNARIALARVRDGPTVIGEPARAAHIAPPPFATQHSGRGTSPGPRPSGDREVQHRSRCGIVHPDGQCPRLDHWPASSRPRHRRVQRPAGRFLARIRILRPTARARSRATERFGRRKPPPKRSAAPPTTRLLKAGPMTAARRRPRGATQRAVRDRHETVEDKGEVLPTSEAGGPRCGATKKATGSQGWFSARTGTGRDGCRGAGRDGRPALR